MAERTGARKGAVALVTGVGGPAGRATAAFLREHQVSVVAADMREVEGERGLLRLPPAVAPEFLSALKAAIEGTAARLLVPTVTEELPLIALHAHRLRAGGCSVFISPPTATDIAHDKWLTAQALAKARVAAPRSLSGVSRAEILRALPLPILSKPRQGRGGRGIEVYDSAADLGEPTPDRVYQEFLGGEEYDVNLFAGNGGEPVALVVLRKTKLRDGRVGNAEAVQRAEVPDVAELAKATSRALDLAGPIDIDVRRDAAGRPRVLEVNARVGANVRSADEVLEALLDRWKEDA